MSRDKLIPVRVSEREDEMLQEIIEYVGLLNTSEGMRYSIAHTYMDLALKKLKPGETVVTLPAELFQEVISLDTPEEILNFSDRLRALILKWKIS